ncbi:hypothetical protein E1B28_005604 [Marasmius oreades]|uniref:PITH domain-containing protein n=1 Tax=Marasmius oreades TaxID=181124 RepID=A0A9P7UW75_9AGAR|nr:uncharacterized protein E1B28_005604 [Marasmius oreades]KAG7094789.1 hypothetical protein E1B28_005604 [Marasmius oreades]
MSDPSTLNSAASDVVGVDHNYLFSCIDRDNVHGLNLTVPEDAKELIKPWDQREQTDKFADSGVDDQIVIHVPFTQNVRIKSILLKVGRGESAPRHLRVYANHPTIVDFQDAETTKPQIDITLLEESHVVEYPVRVAAFASINSLSIFFSDSVGAETSRVYFIGFKGDVRELRKERDTHMDVPAANAASSTLFDRLAEKAGGQQTTAR